MRRLLLLVCGAVLLMGASECSRSVRSPLDQVDRCFLEPWRPNC